MYLHVGCRKSGTSFLQRVVYSNPDAVRRQGLEVPLTGRTPHLRLLQSLGLVDSVLPPEKAAAFLRRLDRNLAAVAGRCALMSHEDLAVARLPEVRRLLELLIDFEVHIVITARDLVRQIPSEWQQCVKTRMHMTYEDFVTAVVARQGPEADLFWARQDVAGVAARWGHALPPERVHIVTVPPPGSPSSLLPERFWGLMGVEPIGFDTGAGSNPSLGAEQAELLRRINVALGDRLADVREEYRPVIRLFVGQVLTAQQGTQLRLPGHLAQWSSDASRDIVDRLRRSGYDVIGDLADLLPVPTPDGDPVTVTVDDGDVAKAGVEALATMLQKQYERQQEILP